MAQKDARLWRRDGTDSCLLGVEKSRSRLKNLSESSAQVGTYLEGKRIEGEEEISILVSN